MANVMSQGTVGSPGLQVYGDPQSGLYSSQAGRLNVAINGSSVGYFASTGFVGAVSGGAGSFTTLDASGAAVLASTLAVTGNVAVNTNKFTVAASSGNTLVAGTLNVTLGVTLASTLAVAGRISNTAGANETTGAGSAALGDNSPAVTNSAPYTWLRFTSSDGSNCFIPMWK